MSKEKQEEEEGDVMELGNDLDTAISIDSSSSGSSVIFLDSNISEKRIQSSDHATLPKNLGQPVSSQKRSPTSTEAQPPISRTEISEGFSNKTEPQQVDQQIELKEGLDPKIKEKGKIEEETVDKEFAKNRQDIIELSSDDSDILSIHTLVSVNTLILSSGDESDDKSVISIPYSDNDDNEGHEKKHYSFDISTFGARETAKAEIAAKLQKMAPRKTPHYDLLSLQSPIPRKKAVDPKINASKENNVAGGKRKRCPTLFDTVAAASEKSRAAFGKYVGGLPLRNNQISRKSSQKDTIEHNTTTQKGETKLTTAASDQKVDNQSTSDPIGMVIDGASSKSPKVTQSEPDEEAASVGVNEAKSIVPNLSQVELSSEVDTPQAQSSGSLELPIMAVASGFNYMAPSSRKGNIAQSIVTNKKSKFAGLHRNLPTKTKPSFGEDWMKILQNVLYEVEHKMTHSNANTEVLRKALRSKNKLLASVASKESSASREFPLLRHVKEARLNSKYVDNEDYPLPKSNATTIYIQKNFGEFDVDDDVHLKAIVNDKSHERQGLIYEEEQINETMRQALSKCLRNFSNVDIHSSQVHDFLSRRLKVNVKRVFAIAEDLRKNEGVSSDNPKSAYEAAMGSHREMFCVRCLAYDCSMHGLPDNLDPDLQAEVAVLKEKSGYWSNGAPLICLPVADSMKDKVEELSKQQVVLAEKLFHIYQNDIEKVASALGVSRASVERCNATLKPMKFRYIKERKADISAFVVGKHRVWSQKKSGRHFFPCSHKNTCSRKVCPCMKNGYYCTNHCIWGPLSRNFFPGCKCKKHCRSNNCACFAAGRECDPDRCSNCKTCTDPTGKPATKQSCRNDSVRMRRHQHLLVAKSTIPNIGWGCFNKNALKRGQYIHEYVGEIINDDVADARRGHYLFNLINSEYTIDGLRYGNKTRFINHSEARPNVIVKTLYVNNEPRIAFYAKRDIPAGTELFFDYGNIYWNKNTGFTREEHGQTGKPIGKKRAPIRSGGTKRRKTLLGTKIDFE